MRMGMACIWSWTAIVSWFIFPQEESLAWLRSLGITSHTTLILAIACLLDLSMGIASCTFASRRLWQFQFVLVLFYSIAIAVWLPEFLFHPFGPISKNITVLGCLAFLGMMEKR